MLAANYSTVRSNLKDYCDKATDENETVIVTRKGEKNIVIMSLDKYNAFMKALRNAEYLDKIDISNMLYIQSEFKTINFIFEFIWPKFK